MTTTTKVTTTAPLVATGTTSWERLSSAAMMAMNGYIGYTILWNQHGGQDNLIAIFVMMCIAWLPTILLSCYYDDIMTTTKTKKNEARGARRPPPCSIQYNQFIIHMIGCAVYTIAMVLISRSILMSSQSSHSILVHRTEHDRRQSIDFIRDASSLLYEYGNVKTIILWSTSSNAHENSHESSPDITMLLLLSLKYVYFAMVTLAGYHRMKQQYQYLFTRNSTEQELISIEKKLCFPLPYLNMIAIQQLYHAVVTTTAATTPTSANNNNIMMMITIMNTLCLLFIFYKLWDYGNQMQQILASSTWNLPLLLRNTPWGISIQQNDWNIRAAPQQMVSTKTTSSSSNHHTNVWRLYGKQYDLTNFVPHHPGGIEPIMLGCHRHDATPLFQSYHPFTIHKALAILSKYEIKDITPSNDDDNNNLNDNDDSDDEKKIEDDTKNVAKVTNMNQMKNSNYPTHVYHENDPFYTILCDRVYRTMKQQHHIDLIRDGRAPFSRQLWYLCMILCNITLLIAHCKGYLWGSILLGLIGVTLGSMGHDGGHYAVSHKAWINDLAVWGIYLSVNPIMWQHQHTYAHHAFTNEEFHDPDVHHFDDIIVKNFAKYMPIRDDNDATEKKQLDFKTRGILCTYTLLRFCFISFGLCYLRPIQFIIDRSMYGRVEWSDRTRFFRTMLFICHWIVHTTVFMILPFYIHREHKMYAWLSMISFFVCSGLYFGVFTQVGHLTEYSYEGHHTKENRKKRHAAAQHSWAAEQIEHSNNFCPQNLFLFLLGGGLGLQIEHHLFPGLNHCHLMKIQPIVQQVCHEYQVSYKSYNTWTEAMRDCMSFFNSH